MTKIRAALYRAGRTAAQAALAAIGTGAVGITDVAWYGVLSVAALATIVSLLMSAASDLPEAPHTATIGKES